MPSLMNESVSFKLNCADKGHRGGHSLNFEPTPTYPMLPASHGKQIHKESWVQ